MRTYLLTFSVVDDLAALVVIAIVYSEHIELVALAWRLGRSSPWSCCCGRAASGTASLYLLIGIAAWVAFLKSGVDPVVVGLVMAC